MDQQRTHRSFNGGLDAITTRSIWDKTNYCYTKTRAFSFRLILWIPPPYAYVFLHRFFESDNLIFFQNFWVETVMLHNTVPLPAADSGCYHNAKHKTQEHPSILQTARYCCLTGTAAAGWRRRIPRIAPRVSRVFRLKTSSIRAIARRPANMCVIFALFGSKSICVQNLSKHDYVDSIRRIRAYTERAHPASITGVANVKLTSR